MAASRFTGKITHSEKTIQALYRAEYHAYELPRILLRMALGLALVFLVFFLSLPTWAKALGLLFGAWFLVSGDFPSQIRADKALQARRSALPEMRCEFLEDRFSLSGEGKMSIPYQKLERLSQDRDFLYLFLAKDSVCMLERSSLRPQPPEDFMRFIEERTGLSWRREFSLLSLNLADLIRIFREKHR